MSKIQILDKFVANRISAGEVVEKPASVVKELIENSLDAKATSIFVEIEEGGTKKICITDNGIGIEKEDVKTAFLPHSTSKIKNVEDLNSIASFGFRGEALASIASVSQIEMTTKTNEEQVGTKIEIEGGEIKIIENCAVNTGTKILVNNLFFNTPARKKFLRKSKLEESEITHIIEKFMLANPSIKFKYVVDGKTIYNTTASGCYDIIYAIYGREVSNNLIEVNFSNDKYKLTGYIGKPVISKPNRTYQTLFVNNRIVQNYLISSAIGSAYENFLMKGKFPFYILNLSVPFDSVDVNVHPTKQEIKFEKPSEIFAFFKTAISNALFETNYVNRLEDFCEKDKTKFTEFNAQNLNKTTEQIDAKLTSVFGEKNDSFEQDSKTSFGKSFGTENDLQFNSQSRLDLLEIQVEENPPAHLEEKKYYEKQASFSHQNLIQNYKILGTAFSTYIILEQNEKLFFIDQHACHERKIYDKLVEEINQENIATQTLLLPYAFSCNSPEYTFFLENIETFQKLGFDIEDFGNNTIKISQIPYVLQNINFDNFINDIKSELTFYRKKTSEVLKDFLAKKACKSAVKGGDILTPAEINSLLADLNEHKVLLCPHGRPIVVEISKSELEKWFKRKV